MATLLKRFIIGGTTISTSSCILYYYHQYQYNEKNIHNLTWQPLKLQNRKTNIISLSSPSTTGIFLDKMSNKEQQECLDVVTLVNTLKNKNNDDGNNTVNDMEDNNLSLTLPFLENSKWEKLNDSNPSLWRRKCFNENTYAYLSYCKHQFSINKYFDFMSDLRGRGSWDSSSKSVTIVEGDTEEDHSLIYHWEVYSPSWPLSNRDYVCSRKIKKDKKYITMKSDAIDHDDYPIKDDVVRVELYHSYTTLKHLNEDECESYLLIVDDQKINLPTSVISYVTSTAIPKFMKEMDKQCEIYHVNKEKN